MRSRDTAGSPPAATEQSQSKRRDLLAFLFLTVVLAPAIAVAVVGGFGFVIWIAQVFTGPPGPPGG